MFRRYKKIDVDSRFPAAEDRGHYSVCGDSAEKLLSFISFYLHLSPFIYRASEACESWIIYFNFLNFMKMKWTTVKKILQIVVTVITTILGTNIIQSCMAG